MIRTPSFLSIIAAAGFVLAITPTYAATEKREGTFSATISVTLNNRLGQISPYIYGQYLEHVQREDECIYPSIWDDTSRFADKNGLRSDVILAARELGTPVVRWPGGCFADVYHWRDGVGPNRKPGTNLHWGGEEPNRFGTDEFLNWCVAVGCQAYINANLGTGTLPESLEWLNYCNTRSQRVQFWGIGNETFGKWEAGHMTAAKYSATLLKWAQATRNADPRVKIMAVGSMSADDPEWDRAVLKQAAPLIDYLTIHAYAYSTGRTNEFQSVAFTPSYFEQRLRKMLRVVDEFSGSRSNAEPIRLAMDEWNVRHYEGDELNRRSPRTLQDAVFVGGLLNTMIRLSPRVGMANYVFLVNGNGVMLVNDKKVVRTPLYYVFQQYGRWMRGDALAVQLTCPTTQPPPAQAHTPKHKLPADYISQMEPWLDVAAAIRIDEKIAIAIVNRHPTDVGHATLQLPRGYRVANAWTLHHKDVLAANTFDHANELKPKVKNFQGSAWPAPRHSVSLLLCERL